MMIALIGMGVSGVGMIILTLLFRFEEQKNTRVLPRFRTWFDEIVARLLNRMHRVSRYFGREVTRQSVHYVVHLVLHTLERGMSLVLHHVGRLQRTNRALAHRVRNEGATRTKLDELRDHKEEVALTPKQRKAHKEHSVGTKL